MEAMLADSGLMDFLCRPPLDGEENAALQAAARACLAVPGAQRAWARMQAAAAEAAGDVPTDRSSTYGLEIPVRVGGSVCGTVGLEGREPVDRPAHRRASAVAEVLSTLEARRWLARDWEQQTIVGCSPAIRRVEAMAHRFARLEEPVLVCGETGVGKELIARTIHCLSGRKDQPLWTVNCAAVPEDLLASELFGHRRGSFTGAIKDQRGRFEQANGATLFLDEVGDMGPQLQAALLRVIEYGEVQQLGDEGKTRRIDVRVVAATNRDLEADVQAGRFRSDLYYRLSALTIPVPPLRERAGDIPVLARHFTRRLAEEWGQPLELSKEALEQVMAYAFPGNVRELKNLILRAAAGAVDGCIVSIELPVALAALRRAETRAPADGARPGTAAERRSAPRPMPEFLGTSTPRSTRHGRVGGEVSSSSVTAGPRPVTAASRSTSDLSLEAATAAHLERVLSMADGNVSRAARILDIPRTTLQSKLARYGLAG